MSDFATPWTAAHQASLSITNSCQIHVHWVGDTIQPSHLLSSPSPLALNLSQHQSLSQSVGFSHQVAKNIDNSASASVLPVNIQYWFPLGLTSLSSLLSKDSQEPSPAPQFETISQSVQFSRSVVSDSLWPRESQHARPPCPSPTPIVYPNSCPLSQWCHPIISSSVDPFSSCPQSFPASGSFF